MVSGIARDHIGEVNEEGMALGEHDVVCEWKNGYAWMNTSMLKAGQKVCPFISLHNGTRLVAQKENKK
jgi:hypothetical protein